MNKIYLGKIINTHGINGELKLSSDLEYVHKILKPNIKLYINDLEYTLTSFRYHKDYVLIKLNNFSNINEVLFFKNQMVYLNRDDLNLKPNEYLLTDLIGATVFDNQKKIGQVTEILLGKKYNYIRVSNSTKSFLVPLINEYVLKFAFAKKELYLQNSSALQI